MTEKTRIVTPEATLAFYNVFEPNEDEKYTVCILIPKSVKIDNLMKLMKDTTAEAYPQGAPKGFKLAIKDGDKAPEDGENPDFFAGHYVINAKSKYAPQVINQRKQEIMDTKEIYMGCKVRALISAYTWEFKGKKGVSFNIDALQKVGDGERLGGGKPEFDTFFEEVEVEVEENALGDFDL